MIKLLPSTINKFSLLHPLESKIEADIILHDETILSGFLCNGELSFKHTDKIELKDIFTIIVKDDPYGRDNISPLARPSVVTTTQPVTVTSLPDKYPSYLKPIPINTRDIEQTLINTITKPDADIQKWLYSTWNAQADAIKYQELRNAVRDAEIPAQWIAQWQQDYSDFINDELDPKWREISSKSKNILAKTIVEKFGIQIEFPETARRLNTWINFRGAELAVNLSEAQSLAVKNVLRRLVVDQGIGPRELGRYLRPIIGLTPNEEAAVYKLREKLVGSGLDAAKVTNRVENYSGFLHRNRAERIARTETAFAYNHGHLECVREYQEQKLIIDPIVKKFYTAQDERVCPFCGPLHNQIIEVEQTFPGLTARVQNVYVPPVHPNCRCQVIYVIMAPYGNVTKPN